MGSHASLPIALAEAALLVIPMILSLTVHEYAHAWVARQLGDTTAEHAGRLTLNPLSHIDPVGTVALPMLLLLARGMGGGFVPMLGWARPVPYDPARFRRGVSVRTGGMLVAAAGPLANLVMAVVAAGVLALGIRSGHWSDSMALQAEPGPRLLMTLLQVNIGLMVFNLLPIAPLDGEKVMVGLLPARAAQQLSNFNQRYGTWLLIALMMGAYRVLSLPVRWVMMGILTLVGLV